LTTKPEVLDDKVKTFEGFLQTARGNDPDGFLMMYLPFINSIKGPESRLIAFNKIKKYFSKHSKFDEEEWKYMMKLN